MKTIKIGLDVHGVINTFPELYSALSHALVAAGHEMLPTSYTHAEIENGPIHVKPTILARLRNIFK